MLPLVSIITPTYNHSLFIAECIQSAINQSFTDWEMLIVNDGSSDETVKVAEKYSASDTRIKVFSHENIGIFRLAENYNFALNHAKGKYIAILEGDDLWEPEKLKMQVEALEANPDVVLAWSSARQVNVDQSQVFTVLPEIQKEDLNLFSNNPVGSILDILFFRNCIPALTALIRKEALVSIGGFKQGYGLPLVDLPTWQELATKGSFYYNAEPTGRWRVYPGQTTKTYLVKMFSGCFNLSIDNFSRFSHNPELSFHVKQNDIENHYRKVMIMAHAREGRYHLIKRQFKEARTNYKKAILLPGGEYMWKLRAVIGLFFSYLHLDVEWLAALLNRPNYKN